MSKPISVQPIKVDFPKIELLLASPLRRALQTCEISFTPCVQRGLKIVALPMAEEASDAPSDTGTELAVLKEEFTEHVDFDHVKLGWFIHEGEYATDPKALNARAAKLRRFIKARPEREIALVSHGFFNHYLTGDVDEKGQQTTPWWMEAELRTFQFVDGSETGGDEDLAMIKETEASLAARLPGHQIPEPKTNRPEERQQSLINFKTDSSQE